MTTARAEVEHYVTLFDSLFLPQGLALHASLKRHAGPFRLWVLCMDEEAKQVLDRLAEPTITTVALADVETAELRAVRPGRSKVEYCWTMTPFTPQIVFERDPSVKRVTYVDADLFLLKSPAPIFDEFEHSGKAVLITDHAYDPELDVSITSGQYCVQFMTFVRDSSEPVRRWWADECVKWCFQREEDGKLGDQKYLDDWPVRFGSLVHVLSQLDVLLAPWNARRFPYSRAIAWHFHGLRLLRDDKVLLHNTLSMPSVVHRAVYAPYVEELGRSLNRLGRQVVQKQRLDGHWFAFAKSILRSLRNHLRAMRDMNPVRDIPR
jgi:hypothetical protein